MVMKKKLIVWSRKNIYTEKIYSFTAPTTVFLNHHRSMLQCNIIILWF